MTTALITAAKAHDIAAFWAATRAELTREPMEAQVETVAEPLPYKKFRVTLRSLGRVRVRALLALPIQGEAPPRPWPVIVTAPGYGDARHVQQGVMLGECQRGYAILQVSRAPRANRRSCGRSTARTSSRGASTGRREPTTTGRMPI